MRPSFDVYLGRLSFFGRRFQGLFFFSEENNLLWRRETKRLKFLISFDCLALLDFGICFVFNLAVFGFRESHLRTELTTPKTSRKSKNHSKQQNKLLPTTSNNSTKNNICCTDAENLQPVQPTPGKQQQSFNLQHEFAITGSGDLNGRDVGFPTYDFCRVL